LAGEDAQSRGPGSEGLNVPLQLLGLRGEHLTLAAADNAAQEDATVRFAGLADTQVRSVALVSLGIAMKELRIPGQAELLACSPRRLCR